MYCFLSTLLRDFKRPGRESADVHVGSLKCGEMWVRRGFCEMIVANTWFTKKG